MRFPAALFIFVVLLLNKTLAQTTAPVTVTLPEKSSVAQSITLSGTITAEQDSQLSVLEAGVVEAILVDAGEKVSKGQALLRLDSRLAKLTLQRREAAAQAAKVLRNEAARLLNEVQRLSKDKVVAQTTISQRQTDLANAEAQLSQAQAELAFQREVLARHTLVAPFDGLIARRHVDQGEWVSQQTQVFELVSDQALRLDLQLPQEYVPKVQQAASVDIQVKPDAINRTLQGKMQALVPVGDALSRTVLFRVSVPNDGAIFAGMSAQADIGLQDEVNGQLWITQDALLHHADGGYSLFVVKNNKAERKSVTVLKRNGSLAAIRGIEQDDQVVIRGNELLQDGQAVSLTSTLAKE